MKEEASLVAQMVKNLPAMWKTWVWSLCSENHLEKGMATHSSILAWRILLDRRAWRATVHGVAESNTTEQLSTVMAEEPVRRSLWPSTIWHRPEQGDDKWCSPKGVERPLCPTVSLCLSAAENWQSTLCSILSWSLFTWEHWCNLSLYQTPAHPF